MCKKKKSPEEIKTHRQIDVLLKYQSLKSRLLLILRLVRCLSYNFIDH